MSVRPTSDKVREAMFSILGTRLTGSRFLDLYAGTGAVGIEALSRGADLVTFVESDPKTGQLLRENLTVCSLLNRADLRIGTTQDFVLHPERWRAPYDLLFADPPYAAMEATDLVLSCWNSTLLSPDALMILEQDARTLLPDSTHGATLVRRYVYGDTALFVYRRIDQGSLA